MIYVPPVMSSIMYYGPMLVVNIANHVKPLKWQMPQQIAQLSADDEIFICTVYKTNVEMHCSSSKHLCINIMICVRQFFFPYVFNLSQEGSAMYKLTPVLLMLCYLTHARTHTHTRYISDVSSSAESENPRIWNSTTVAIFGMVGTLSERNYIRVYCTALPGLLFCNCRDSDQGIITGLFRDGFAKTVRIRQDLDATWTQSTRNGNEIFLQIMLVPKDTMLRDASNCRECQADLSGPFPIPLTLLRTYITTFRQ